ncbi:hypothetical protein Sjap_008810 [Stephania japonica]|uniref:START domain-containing protein n=1 Tax=Stephania japonica TaxID=461633 RepID=A0AAP0JQA5_9MAGN
MSRIVKATQGLFASPLQIRAITDDMKKKIVQHIGTLWRSWKSRVTRDLKQALEDGWSDDEINSKLQPEGKAKNERADISRADLWIEGHKNKKGQPHNDEIAGVVEKINECQRRSSASSSQLINKDPIVQVFGPEHQGRVSGLVFGVTLSNVRATTQSTILVRKLQADFRRLEEKHEQLAEFIRSQQMPPSSRQIVGEGEVETDDPMHLVDGIPIGGNAYLVYVERVFESNAFLWRNQNNWTTLDNALGEIIPWPKEAVADSLIAIVSDSDTEEGGEDASSNSKKKGWFSTIFQSIAGKANLEKSDLESALNALKDRLMVKNVNRWAEMFPCMIARTSTTDVISIGVGGTRNGALQLMRAELQVLSPLVPIREVNFLRFCKQHAEGVWAVVDVSIDADRDASNPSNFLTCRRLPSGCKVMAEALERILTPQRSIDILRDVHAAKEQGRPYLIVFVGVNGVGKSTNLAKIAYWLQHHNISVICDLVVVFLWLHNELLLKFAMSLNCRGMASCTLLGALNLGKWVHDYIKRNGFNRYVKVNTAMIDMYAKCGSLEDAISAFENMRFKDTQAWSTMIVACAIHGQGAKAISVFKNMKAAQVQPDAMSMRFLLGSSIMVVSRITDTLVRDVAAVMEYKGLKLQEAVDWVVKNRLDGQAGMIVVSSEGEVAYGFNSMLCLGGVPLKMGSWMWAFGSKQIKWAI